MVDAGALDAGLADAGVPDAGPTDAGVLDAGIADAGIPDAGRAIPPCTPGGDGGYRVEPFPRLSDYCLVGWGDAGIEIDPALLPYDVNDALFADYAVKLRGIWFPPGTSASYDPLNAFAFPLGTILTKSFGFPDDRRKAQPTVQWIETRLLVSTDAGWQPYPYLWDADAGDADLSLDGGAAAVSWIDLDGGFVSTVWPIPRVQDCKECHLSGTEVTPIGPKARQLNRVFDYADGGENQLVHWSRLGVLTGAPADPNEAPLLVDWEDVDAGTIEQRARAYLEGNCAHCHSATGAAAGTYLYLWASETDAGAYGVCKVPNFGPCNDDIDPGDPSQSYVAYRMAALQPSQMMPPLGRTVVDQEAVDLVNAWITALPGSCP